MEKKHVQGLDSLRAIAIIGVILFHMFPAVVKGGYLGVVVFFVLSGYLISLSVLSDIDKDRFSLLNFYKKRILRIYPPLIIGVLMITVAAVIMAPASLNGGIAELVSIFDGTYNIRQIMMNASYFTRITNSSPFTHLWSLGVELQFYLIFPLIIYLYRKCQTGMGSRPAVIIYALITFATFIPAAVLYVPGQDVSRLYYGTDTRIFSLMAGSLIGILQREGMLFFKTPEIISFHTLYEKEQADKKRRIRRIALFIPVMLASFVMMALLDGENQWLYRGGMQAYTILILIAIIILIKEPDSYGIGYTFDDGPLGWVGKNSYEFYIMMYPVIFFFGYMKWNVAFYSYIIQGVVIVALGMLLHFLCGLSYEVGKKKKFDLKYAGLALFMVLSIVVVALNPAPVKEVSDDMAQLEKELAENEKMLEEQELATKQDETNATGETGQDDSAEVASAKETDNGQTVNNAGSGQPVDESLVEETAPSDLSVTMVGDSVMLGASQSIKNILPNSYVDAKQSRQVSKSLEVLQNLGNQGKIANTVVIALGTNGTFNSATGNQLIDYLGPDRTIYWVNVYGSHLSWQQQSNAAIDAVAANYPNVTVIDWASLGARHPEWFYSDGIHLNFSGRDAYANLIKNSISVE